MDIKKLAPWNWFKKEEEAEKGLSVSQVATKRHDHPLQQIHYEIDRMFDSVFTGFGLSRFGSLWPELPKLSEGLLKPTLDVGCTDKEYTISIEVPGVDEKDIRLELSDTTLTIRGEKKRDHEEKDKDYYRIERSYGSFQRVLSLPDDADQDGIKAKFKKGVLNITVPRRELPKPNVKRIEVKTE
jgi:HSP20 family protein